MLLIWAGSAWILGLILGSYSSLALWHWVVLALSAALSALAFRSNLRFRSLFILLCILFLAAARWVTANPQVDPDHVAYYADTNNSVQITGEISADPELLDDQIRLEISAERIWIPDLGIQRPVEGKVLIHASPLRTTQYGERLRFTGLLESPPDDGDFSYRAYLARQDILAWMPEAQARSLGMGEANRLLSLLYRLRRAALLEVQRLFPYPEAPLIAGILLGIEGYIPDELSRAYRATGTTHIIAISGFNITIMAGLAIAVLGRALGRVRGLFAAGVIILLYTIFVGGDAPVVRAAIMGSLTLFARYLGRLTHGMTSLSAAAILMTLANPRSLLDVGFQLSFFATLGLILYADPISQICLSLLSSRLPHHEARRWGRIIAETLLFTLAAQLTTLPIMAWHFHQISITSLIANALILPLQPLLMILSGLATIMGLIWHPLGQLLAWFAWPFAALSNQIVTLLASTPGGVVYTGIIHPGYLLAYFSLLFLITAGLSTPHGQKLLERLKPLLTLPRLVAGTAGFVAVTLASLMIWRAYARLPDGLLHVTVLNVGNGEAILIQTPSGSTILGNGGPSPVKLGTTLGQLLPFGNRQIDWLLIGGSRYEQLAGLREIAAMAAPQNVLSITSAKSSAYQRVIEQIQTADTPIIYAEQGQRLDLGNGADLELLTLGQNGMTLLISYGNARMLFPLGLAPGEIPDLLARSQTKNITAVLLADGGYEAVNPISLLEHLNPQVVLISCQAGACPTQYSPEAGSLPGYSLTTASYGSIELITDGQSLWITTEFSPMGSTQEAAALPFEGR